MKYSATYSRYITKSRALSLFSSLYLCFSHVRGTRKYFNYAETTKFLSVSTTTRTLARFDSHNETYKCSCTFDSDWNFRWIFLSLLIFCPLDFGRNFHGPIRVVVHSDDSPLWRISGKRKTTHVLFLPVSLLNETNDESLHKSATLND